MRYFTPDHCETVDDAVDIGDGNGMFGHNSFTAEEAAEYEHDNREGWEASWPMKITLVGDDGRESTWEVDREFAPTFSAVKSS